MIHLVRLRHIPVIRLHRLVKRIKFHQKLKVGHRDFGLDWLVGLQLDTVLVQGGALLRLHRSDMGQVHAQRMLHQGRVVGLEGVVRVSIVIRAQAEGIEMTTEVLEECILVQDLAEQGVGSWAKAVDEKARAIEIWQIYQTFAIDSLQFSLYGLHIQGGDGLDVF
jgi:hypothetical protein